MSVPKSAFRLLQVAPVPAAAWDTMERVRLEANGSPALTLRQSKGMKPFNGLLGIQKGLIGAPIIGPPRARRPRPPPT